MGSDVSECERMFILQTSIGKNMLLMNMCKKRVTMRGIRVAMNVGGSYARENLRPRTNLGKLYATMCRSVSTMAAERHEDDSYSHGLWAIGRLMKPPVG